MVDPNAIRLEVAPVDREHLACSCRLGDCDQRGVREVHRTPFVLNHQRERTLQRQAVEEPHAHAAARDEFTHTGPAADTQQVKCFGKDGNRRRERFTQGFENGGDTRMSSMA